VPLPFESGASRYTSTLVASRSTACALASVSSLVMRPWSTSAQVRHPKDAPGRSAKTDCPCYRLGLLTVRRRARAERQTAAGMPR
jgi:hypothetical protein